MLCPSTLGYEIATPTELPMVPTINHKPHPNLPQGEEKKSIQRLHTSLFQEKKRNHNLLKHSENEFPPLGEGWGGAYNQLFFYRQRRSFFTSVGCFLNHAGCCRHAKHGVGDGGDDKEENEFSDWRHRQTPKRRSRQHPPWLFVFISATKRSSY